MTPILRLTNLLFERERGSQLTTKQRTRLDSVTLSHCLHRLGIVPTSSAALPIREAPATGGRRGSRVPLGGTCDGEGNPSLGPFNASALSAVSNSSWDF